MSYRLCYNTDHDIRVRHFVIFWLHLCIHVVDLLWASIHFDLPSICELASSFMLTCEFPLKEFRCKCQRHSYYQSEWLILSESQMPEHDCKHWLLIFHLLHQTSCTRPVFFSHKASLIPSILDHSHPLNPHSALSVSLVFYSFQDNGWF